MMRLAVSRGRWQRGGVTLVELLIVASLLALMLGAVLGLLLGGLRLYQHTASADWASFDAGQAVERLEGELAGCFRVTGRYETRVTFTTPAVIWDATAGLYVPTQPLSAGASIRYYLSDANGTLGHSGTYLWRAVRPAGGASYVRDTQPLADNIVGLQLTYELAPEPREASTRYVNLWVRARVKEGGTTTERTHSARILVRNWQFGPITAETGVDEEE